MNARRWILTREDGRLDLARTASQTYDRWRGFTPWPGCHAAFRGKRFLLHRLRAAELDLPEPVDPGALFMHEDKLVLGAAQNTALVLDEVQLEGKARMSGAAFWRDFQVKQGERVE
jgi:methionyl-tRNA formyltransferase